MCTTDTRTVTVASGDGAPGAVIHLAGPFDTTGASPTAVRDTLAHEAWLLHEALVENLPRTTLRALTSLMIAGLAASLDTRPDRPAAPSGDVGFALVAGDAGPRIDTIAIDEMLPPGDTGDLPGDAT